MRLGLASLHPRILSGQIDSLAGLGRAMVRRGHGVRLVAPFDTSALLRGDLTELDTGPRGLLRGTVAMLRAVPRVVEASSEADLVHMALPTPAFAWLADLVQRTVRPPVVVGFEGHLPDPRDLLEARRRPGALSSQIPLCAVNNRLFARIGPRLCRCYVVSSEYQRRELLGLGFAADP